jgi:hypothetical protein
MFGEGSNRSYINSPQIVSRFWLRKRAEFELYHLGRNIPAGHIHLAAAV